jgi:hypothetical protein
MRRLWTYCANPEVASSNDFYVLAAMAAVHPHRNPQAQTVTLILSIDAKHRTPRETVCLVFRLDPLTGTPGHAGFRGR